MIRPLTAAACLALTVAFWWAIGWCIWTLAQPPVQTPAPAELDARVEAFRAGYQEGASQACGAPSLTTPIAR